MQDFFEIIYPVVLHLVSRHVVNILSMFLFYNKDPKDSRNHTDTNTENNLPKNTININKD